AIRCRLGALGVTVGSMSELDSARRARVIRQVDRADVLLATGQARCAAANARAARRKLRKAGGRLHKVLGALRPRHPGVAVPVAVQSVTGTATGLLDDTRTLGRGLACP